MEQKWLDDFRALVRHGNFTRAAAERNTTQPAFSRRIMQLEEWCGVPLFNRTTQPIALTQAGRVFQERAEKIHEEICDTQAIMQTTGSYYNKALRIYTTNTLATCYLHEWMQEYHVTEPFSLVIASVNGCVEAYNKNLADIALIPDFYGYEIADGYFKTVKTDHLRLYAANANILSSYENILSGRYLAYMPNTWFGRKISAYMAEHGLIMKDSPVCESASAEALFSLCKQGMGAAWLPDIMAKNNMDIISIMPQHIVSYDIIYMSGTV